MQRIAICLLAGVALFMGCAGGQTEGQKQVDQLTSEINSLAKAIEKGKAELTTTLAAHEAITNNKDGDLLTPFKKFNSGLDKVEKQREEIRGRIEKVKAAAQPYFETWKLTLDKFTSAEMKTRSQERMNQTRERYEVIQNKAEQGREAYDALMPMLRDHALFWSADLNAESAAALGKDDEKIKVQADTLFKITDEVLAGAKKYNESVAMRTTPPPAPEESTEEK